MQQLNPNLIIPIGTQVVTTIAVTKSNGDVAFTRGAVGVIVSAPAHNTHAYSASSGTDELSPCSPGTFECRV